MLFSRLAAIALIFGLSAGAWAASLAPVQVERAHYLEGTLDDLEGALEIYQAVASDLKNPRRWRAEATFGLARCHDKLESYVTANRYYLEVVKNFGEFQGLADRAGDEILAVSRVLAQDGGAVSDDDLVAIGEIALALNAFVNNGEVAAAADAGAALAELLGGLMSDVQGTPDEEAFADMNTELIALRALITAGDVEGAQDSLAGADELDFYIGATFSPDPGELFTPVLRWKDRVARGLADDDAAAVLKFCKRISTYLADFEELPDGEEKAFAKALADQSKVIAGYAGAGEMAKARRALFDDDQKRFKEQGVLVVYLEGYDDQSVALLPLLNVIHSWMDIGVEEAETETEAGAAAAKPAITKSLVAARALAAEARGEARVNARELEQLLEKMLAALEAGRPAELGTLYEEFE